MSTNIPKPLRDCLQSISKEHSADILLYSAEINAANADTLISVVQEQPSTKENVILVLATYGGDPHAAFRIARFLKNIYEKFTLFIFGYCKSAGTLVAIGADEIVMSDFAELGPLDVQVSKDDNFFKRSSGLDLQKSLSVLSKQIYSVFEESFIGTTYSSGGVITTKTAADIASSMAVGLLAPISSQIDPLRLGEVHRSMDVAYQYGIRLNSELEETIRKLVEDYPSHSFVIDRKEAKDLFPGVRNPSRIEIALEKVLSKLTRSPSSEDVITSLNRYIQDDLDDEDLDEYDEDNSDLAKEDNDKFTENDRGVKDENNAKSTCL